MKKFTSVCLSCLIAGTLSLAAGENPREFFWENALGIVREKPKDAISAFDDIATQSAQAAAWDEYALALCMRSAARASIEGRDAHIAMVRELQRAVESAPAAEARAFLSAHLAYAFQTLAGSPRFGQMRPSTPIDGSARKDDDVALWSRERLIKEALNAYKSVFADADILKKIPVAAFAAKKTENEKLLKMFGRRKDGRFGLFSLQDSPAADFPTLYDFFAQDAVKFYGALSGVSGEAENALREQLADWKAFHANDADKSAYARAVFAGFSQNDDDYENTLKNFAKEFSYYPIAAEAFAALAQNALDDERREEAFLFAKEGFEKYKQHKNVSGCSQILNSLSAQNVNIVRTEHTWFDAESAKLRLNAKNIEKIYFRAVPWDWQDFLRRERNRPDNLSPKESREILFSEEGAITWSQDLEKFTDFADHDFVVPAPFEKFEPGFYFITASADPNFKSFHGQYIPYLTVWISNIAVIADRIPARQNAKTERALRGYVVDARSGEPLENVEIAAWNKVYGGDRVPVESVKSTADGSFELPGLTQGFVALAVAPDGNAVSLSESTSWAYWDMEKPSSDVGKLFTDRAIYRPGQLIHFKGIRARYDADVPGSEKVIPGEKVEIRLFDANDKEVAKTECYTGAFGSFAGTFTAPTGLLKGNFKLKFDKVETSIVIEEYKRPKFEVSIEVPEKQFILGQRAEMLVNAKAFTGMPLGNAKISWRVTEDTWEKFSSEDKTVAHGEGKLDADGNFKISFPTEVKKLSKREARKLSPTEKAEQERELSRFYSLEVAVTDASGETREQREFVRIANCGVKAYLSSGDKGWELTLTNYSGKTLAVPARFCIYEAVLPETIRRHSRLEPYPKDEEITLGKKLFETQLTGDTKKKTIHIGIPRDSLPDSGMFIGVLSGKDAFARPFEVKRGLTLIGGKATHCPVKLPIVLSKTSPAQEAKPGETFSVVWGSGYDSARARVEIAKNGKILKTFWTQKGHTQETISVPVTRELIGGFNMRITQFRDGRKYSREFNVRVPEADKSLKIDWQRFRTKLVPGGAEVWTARVTLPDGTPASAEMLALLYDRSLDSFLPNLQDTGSFNLAYDDSRNRLADLYTSNDRFSTLYSSEKFPETPYAEREPYKPINWILPWGYASPRAGIIGDAALGFKSRALRSAAPLAAMAQSAPPVPENAYGITEAGADIDEDCMEMESEGAVYIAGSASDTKMQSHGKQKNSPVSPRKNLRETAFFQPFINTDANGVAQITFVVPEALTGWRFIAFAHDKSLRSGSLESDAIVTGKPLMAQPNAPRFLREGDTIEFPVKISNSGKTLLKGTAQLSFARSDNGKDVSAELCEEAREKSFEVPAGSTQTLTWKVRIPENCEFLTYRVSARAGEYSDGEEALLPILPKKITVTESANFLIRAGAGKKATLFDEQALSDKKLESLNIDVNADPAWDAFLALPRLALLARENDSSDSVFYRFYTNKLAEKIAETNPVYRRKFEALTALGSDSETLRSPLEQDKAKNIALEATPFVKDADDETAQRRAVAQLFEKNTMARESLRARETLRERLSELNGDGWSWFPGAQEISPRVTRSILMGLIRLRDIGALDEAEIRFAYSALGGLDKRIDEIFNCFNEKGERIPATLNCEIAEWLYLRSRTRNYGTLGKAWNYYLGEAEKSEIWTTLPRYSQAQIALALRNVKPESPIPARIVESIRQYATESETLGMYWKDAASLCPWCVEFASIETQAMMIELFAKVAKDKKAVEELKIWLLTQKQAQAWQVSRATAEAVFALLCTPETDAPKADSAVLTEDAMTRTSASGETTESALQVFAGTQKIPDDGKSFSAAEITPEHGKIQVKNPQENPVFVSAVWTYETEINTVSDNEAPSGFKIRKSLWKKTIDADGKERLYPIRGETLQPGDEIVVRLVIEADRDFEFVHVKDLRASGCEPTGTRSGYRWNNAVWYYTTTSDTAEEFFFDRLPRGKHVLEYSLRTVHCGTYSAGFAEIRSLYAPEFSAHSKSSTLQTR